MVISIHQPNFFPYEGILEKIARSDLHVVFAHAQYEKGGYQNRFRIGGRWMTLCVARQGVQPLTEKTYRDPEGDFAAIERKIPAHAAVLAYFRDAVGYPLVGTNVEVLRRILRFLEIRTPIAFDEPIDLRATERLVAICRQHGATTYLSGPSGPKYLDFDLFKRAGIAVEVQERSESKRAALEVLAARRAFRAA